MSLITVEHTDALAELLRRITAFGPLKAGVRSGDLSIISACIAHDSGGRVLDDSDLLQALAGYKLRWPRSFLNEAEMDLLKIADTQSYPRQRPSRPRTRVTLKPYKTSKPKPHTHD